MLSKVLIYGQICIPNLDRRPEKTNTNNAQYKFGYFYLYFAINVKRNWRNV